VQKVFYYRIIHLLTPGIKHVNNSAKLIIGEINMKVLQKELSKSQAIFKGRASLLEKLRQASVQLVSKDRTFVASGMLCGVFSPKATHSPRAIIATAKHNLYVAVKNEKKMFSGKYPKPLPDSFYDRLKENVKIKYRPDTNGVPQDSAVIYGYRDVPEMEKFVDEWSYDLLLLQSTDKELVKFAGEHGAFASEELIDAYTNFNNRGIYQLQEYDLIQLGYGKRTDSQLSAGSNLLYRLTNWHNEDMDLKQNKAPTLEGYTVKQNDTKQSNGTYQRILIITANTNSTTMEGDSGGPLFVVSKKSKTEFIPLAVTLGDNYSTSRIITSKTTKNNAATSVKGLERLF
jgi:hypothetical protein